MQATSPATLRRIGFALSGVIVLLGSVSSPVLLPYPLFVAASLGGWRLPTRIPVVIRLFLATFVATFILEVGAWLDNFLKDAPAPALFHPQLIPDLIVAPCVYLAWFLTWWFVLPRWHFTPAQVALTSGLYGVFIEQQGKIFLAGLATLPMGLVFWLFVAVAYGGTMGFAYVLTGGEDAFPAAPKRDGWQKYAISGTLLFVLTFVTSYLWGILLMLIPILPPKKLPMRAHPFW